MMRGPLNRGHLKIPMTVYRYLSLSLSIYIYIYISSRVLDRESTLRRWSCRRQPTIYAVLFVCCRSCFFKLHVSCLLLYTVFFFIIYVLSQMLCYLYVVYCLYVLLCNILVMYVVSLVLSCSSTVLFYVVTSLRSGAGPGRGSRRRSGAPRRRGARRPATYEA